MKEIKGLKMNYKQWRKYLKPLMINGYLSDLYLTQNEFIGKLPKGKYWFYEDNKKAEIVGLPVKRILVNKNVFMGQLN